MSQVDEAVGHHLDEAGRPAHVDRRLLSRGGDHLGQYRGVDASGVSLPAARLLTGQRQAEPEPVRAGKVTELLTVDQVGGAPGRVEKVRRDSIPLAFRCLSIARNGTTPEPPAIMKSGRVMWPSQTK